MSGRRRRGEPGFDADPAMALDGPSAVDRSAPQIPDVLPARLLPIDAIATHAPDWSHHGTLIGSDTEEIPVVVDPDAATSAGADPALGRAGTLAGERFNGRRLVRALVLAVWSLAWLAIGLVGYRRLHELLPYLDRWVAYLAAAVFAVAAVVYLANVDEPDPVVGGAGAEFHELEWTRRQLFSIRPRDIAWAIIVLSPLVVFAAFSMGSPLA